MQSGFTGWNKNTFLKKRWIEIRQMYFLKDFEFVQFEQLQWTEAAHSVSNMISQPQIKRVWIKSRQTEEILMLSDRQITLHLFYERCVISNELEQKNKNTDSACSWLNYKNLLHSIVSLFSMQTGVSGH